MTPSSTKCRGGAVPWNESTLGVALFEPKRFLASCATQVENQRQVHCFLLVQYFVGLGQTRSTMEVARFAWNGFLNDGAP